MKRSPNHIDNILQDHFHDHEVPVLQKEELWARIRRPKSNRRRMLPFFFTLLGITCIGIITTSNQSPYFLSSIQPFSNSTHQKSEQLDIAKIEHTTSITRPSDRHNKKNNNTQNSAIKANENEDLDINPLEHPNKLEDGSTKRTNATISSSTKNEISDISEIRLPTNVVTGNNKSQELHLSSTSNYTTIQEANLVYQNRTDVNISEKAIPSNQLSNRSSQHSPSTHNYSEKLSSIALLDLYVTSLQQVNSKGLLKRCKLTGKSKSRIFIEPYIQISQPIESVGLASEASDQTTYLDQWNEQFNPLVAIKGGILIGNEWSNGISVSAGLEYQRLETQYRAVQNVTEVTTIYDPMAFFFFDQNNEIVWVGDSVTSVTTFDRTISHANTTELVNLPIHLSYRFAQVGPFNIKATVGGILNLSVQYRGRFLQPDMTLQIVDESNQDQFVATSLGIGFEGGIDASYYLGGNWELYLSPRYRFNQSSYFSNNQSIRTSRDYIGLRTGVRYLF